MEKVRHGLNINEGKIDKMSLKVLREVDAPQAQPLCPVRSKQGVPDPRRGWEVISAAVDSQR